MKRRLPKYLTRHIGISSLERQIEGYFHFSTTEYLRAGGEGRMSDGTEGTMIHSIEPKGLVKIDSFKTSRGTFRNGVMLGPPDGGVTALGEVRQTSDYVACLCPGPFDLYRAASIREKGNPGLDAFVTYNRKRLMNAIHRNLIKQGLLTPGDNLSRHLVLDHCDYGNRATTITPVDGALSGFLDTNTYSSWRRTVFVKPLRFEHEDEFRIAFNPSQMGTLPQDTPLLKMGGDDFKNAVVAQGTY